MKYCLIKRAVNAIIVDGDDVDRDPETIKVYGKVTFTPQLNDGDIIQYAGVDGAMSMVLPPITVSISDGEIMHRGGVGVKLAAGGPGCNPETIRWRADFTNMQAGGWAFNLKPVVFDAIPDGEVDLTIVAPLASTSEPITRGPAGVSVSNITVDGSYLVFTGTSEAGSSELARIPLEQVVASEAQAAAVSATSAVQDLLSGDVSRAETAASQAADSAASAAQSAQDAAQLATDATISTKGLVKLAGDLGGSADAPTVPALASKADLVGGLIPTSQLPAVALTKPQVVADRAGMLALTAQEGDVAVITSGTDKGTYMLGPGASTNFESWVALATPTDAVTSVNGQTGVVNLAASDVGAAPSSHTHTSAQISDATSSPTASMVIKRDSAGRAQVADPAVAQDIATKGWVDANKVQSVATPYIVYGTDSNAIDYEYPLDSVASPTSIMLRFTDGCVDVATPVYDQNAATKGYVDTQVATRAPSSHTHTSAQVSDATSSPTASMVMKRDSAGRAQVADPSASADIATKAYVDAFFSLTSVSLATGVIAYKRAGIVSIHFDNWTKSTLQLPAGYYPNAKSELIYLDSSNNQRGGTQVNTNGSLTTWGTVPTYISGVITYVAA